MSRNYYVYAYLRGRDSEHGAAGTPYYVGKGKGRRAFRKGEGEVPKPATRERVIFLGMNLNEAQALASEVHFIRYYGRIDQGTGLLRNRTDGGDGGSNPSADTRQKMRQAKLGKSPANKGKRGMWSPSEEQRKKMRQNTRWRLFEPETKVKRRRGEALKGKPRSEETKRKMSETTTGKKRGPESAEHRANISAALKGKTKSPEAIRKRTETRRINRELAAIATAGSRSAIVADGKRPQPV